MKIDVGREYSLNPAPEVGGVQETVTVTAGADLINATTPTLSSTVSPQQVRELPLVDRNPLDLLNLQAGTTGSQGFQVSTVNGMRTTMTNITRDGINIQDAFIRTNATDFSPGRPSVDDTGEFTISTGLADADAGYGGAQIRLVAPRGPAGHHDQPDQRRDPRPGRRLQDALRCVLDRPVGAQHQPGGARRGPVRRRPARHGPRLRGHHRHAVHRSGLLQ